MSDLADPSGVASLAERPPHERNRALIERAEAGAFDFLDFGTHKGAGLRFGLEHLGGRFGLGTELNEAKARTAITEGLPVFAGDILELPLTERAFRFAVFRHILEHLPDAGMVEQVLAKVLPLCTEFVYIEQPDFSSEPYLNELGLTMAHTTMEYHTCPLAESELEEMLVRLGVTRYIVGGLLPIATSENRWVHSLGSKPNRWIWNAEEDLPKPSVPFDRPFHRDMVIIAALSGDADIASIARRIPSLTVRREVEAGGVDRRPSPGPGRAAPGPLPSGLHPADSATAPPPEDLTPLARASGDVSMFELSPSSRVERRSALCDLSLAHAVPAALAELTRRFDLAPDYEAPRQDEVRIMDAWVDARTGLAFTSDGEYVRDTVRTHRQLAENGYRQGEGGGLVRPAAPLYKLDRPATLVGVRSGGNYFHWLFEAVVRALLMRRDTDAETLLVPPLSGWEREALLTAGIAEEAVLELPAEGFVSVPELIVPPRGYAGGAAIAPGGVEALHRLASPSHGARRRLFVSRAGARRRRIANEPDLVELLWAYGFELVHAERLSVREQIETFSQAEAVVAMHGAGLANLAFVPDGALAIELQPAELDEYRLTLYWHIAACRGLRYAQLVCAAAPDQESVGSSSRNLIVDKTQLKAVLDRHLSRQPASGAEADIRTVADVSLAELDRLRLELSEAVQAKEELERAVTEFQRAEAELRGSLGALRRRAKNTANSRTWRAARRLRAARSLRGGSPDDPMDALLRDIERLEAKHRPAKRAKGGPARREPRP